MLFPDLSAPEAHHSSSKRFKWPQSPPIAFISDRFLALIFDFLLASPLVSLVIAGFVKRAKTLFLLDSQSPEGLALGLVVFVLGALFVLVFQSAFLYYLHATPGQYFFQLRVVSYPQSKNSLSFSQCLVRSFCFSASCLLLAIPFLEVLGHPLRRAFHERASDTMVVTLKKFHDDGPHEIEQRFISSSMRTGFFVFVLFSSMSLFKTFGSFVAETAHENVAVSTQCKAIGSKSLQGPKRLDAALALYALKEISGDCLNHEADYLLWKEKSEFKDMAYLAKYISAESTHRDEKETQHYYKLICESTNSRACLLADYLDGEKDSKVLKGEVNKLMVTQVLLMNEMYQDKNFVGSLAMIEKLKEEKYLQSVLEKPYTRAIWSLREAKFKDSGRAPASENSNKWLEEFKSEYQIK
jgi:uncharacterized RDD family membrane protein YckC